MLERGLLELVQQEQRFLPGSPPCPKCPSVQVFTLLQLRTLRTTIHYLEIGRLLQDTSIVEAKLSSRGSTSVAACIRLCLVCPSCLLGAACKSLACIRLCPRGQSCLHAPSTGCGPDVCDICTSYVSRQCTSSDGDNASPYLLRRLATPNCCSLPPEGTSYS
ncbi:hypothetical protein Tco_0602335 [Tanacetum coccineum]